MKHAKHTPGPWKISKNLSPHCRYITDRNGHVVAEVDTALHAGNIDLLVTAPEMLQLLKRVVGITTDKDATKADRLDHINHLAKTLIARIEGGGK